MDKRKDPPTSDGVLIKRQKPEENTPSNAVTIQTKGSSGALIQTVMTRNEEAANHETSTRKEANADTQYTLVLCLKHGQNAVFALHRGES